MSVRLRYATRADGPAVAALWLESARAAFAHLLPAGFELPRPVPGRFMATLEEPGVVMLLGESDEGPLGFVTYGSSRDGDPAAASGELRSFFVAAGRWREGIGGALMGRALEELPRMGHDEVTVWSFAANAGANAFYEHQGFSPDGAEKRDEAWANLLQLRFRR